MPEAKLAREADIRYASVSYGKLIMIYWHPDHENVDVQQVVKVLLGNAAKAKNMIKNLIENFENHIDPNDPKIIVWMKQLFLPRQKGHISQSKINFRANIDALKQLGVTDIIIFLIVWFFKKRFARGKFVL